MKYPFLDLGTVNAEYRGQLEEAALRVIRSGRYVGGAEVEMFEQELAASAGTAFAVGVSNGLDALRLIFRAYIDLGTLKPGDAVIVPANTYIASVLAVTDNGLVPVFAEPDPETLNIDTSRLEEYLTDKVKAILTVHLYGRTAYDRLMAEFAAHHGLLIIEDNAQSIGATSEYPSSKGTYTTGSLGNAAAFSFYPTKNIGALGDAGAVTTDDERLARAVRALANYGSDTRYHNIYEGFNCRLDPIQAAVLRVKLPHMEKIGERRRAIAAIYDSHIENPLITKPLRQNQDRCVWHQYVIRCDYRNDLRKFLEANGVGTDIHYAVPPHRQPCYSRFADTALPITDRIADTVLSLPVSECTTEADAADISAIINRFKL